MSLTSSSFYTSSRFYASSRFYTVTDICGIINNTENSVQAAHPKEKVKCTFEKISLTF